MEDVKKVVQSKIAEINDFLNMNDGQIQELKQRLNEADIVRRSAMEDLDRLHRMEAILADDEVPEPIYAINDAARKAREQMRVANPVSGYGTSHG